MRQEIKREEEILMLMVGKLREKIQNKSIKSEKAEEQLARLVELPDKKIGLLVTQVILEFL